MLLSGHALRIVFYVCDYGCKYLLLLLHRQPTVHCLLRGRMSWSGRAYAQADAPADAVTYGGAGAA